MQRHREVWVITSKTPYLAIDEDLLRERMASIASFAVLSSAYVFQNIDPVDLRTRLATALIGPGIAASTSPSGDMFVEGEANP